MQSQQVKPIDAIRMISPFVQIMDEYQKKEDTRSLIIYAGAYRMVSKYAIHLRASKERHASDVVVRALSDYRDQRYLILSANDVAEVLEGLSRETGFSTYHAMRGIADLMGKVVRNEISNTLATEMAAKHLEHATQWLSDKPVMTAQDEIQTMSKSTIDRYVKIYLEVPAGDFSL